MTALDLSSYLLDLNATVKQETAEPRDEGITG